jgi:hypothetical protein
MVRMSTPKTYTKVSPQTWEPIRAARPRAPPVDGARASGSDAGQGIPTEQRV